MPDSIGVAQVYEVMEDPTAFYIVMEKDGRYIYTNILNTPYNMIYYVLMNN